ncbi:MAG TPA: bifunctional lysylphosphatidylglycerol flippase/synthetase MprF [Gemmatimonas sp.]|uniref:bifunctional lysylphosphatidylglycerol flippase/synthetase MprF n=1 Tax=Gemmatimonas sp. TaxID=1962908 RepID=UPI002ED81999
MTNLSVNPADTTSSSDVADATSEEPSLWRAWLPPVAMLLLLSVALFVVHHELAGTGYAHLRESLRAIPAVSLQRAAALTVLSYLLLCGYDLLALRYVGIALGLARAAMTSLLAYSLSQTLGFALLTGGAVRVRFWSTWGLSTQQIAQAAGFVSATFVVGVLSVCGIALTLESRAMLEVLRVPVLLARVLGVSLLVLVGSYIAWAALRARSELVVRGWRIPVPPPTLAASQVLLAFCDWGVAGLVLYMLLPVGHDLPLLAFLGVFVLAQFVAVVSHVPGGLGVFESVMLVALRGVAPPAQLLAMLLAYRVVYYFVPFTLGLVTLAAVEVRQHRARVPELLGTVSSTAASVFGGATRLAVMLQPLLPTAIGLSTFVGGALLLFSGATPAAHGRVRALTAVLPLGLVEFSHFTASLAGVGLMVLGAALRRRLDAAWGATVVVLALGIATSLLKGLDWEEASVLGVVLLAVVASRRAFYRPTALTTNLLTPGWMVAVIGVVGASIWLGFFAYRRVDFSNDLWWEFAARGNAPRFLRASAGTIVAVLTVGLWRLFRPATHRPEPPTETELAQAHVVVQQVPECTPALALLGDKALLFSDDAEAFVMYGVSGRSWIAMGDPVGVGVRQSDVAWRFREEADSHGAWPVFYQVTPQRLPLYIDLGLTLLKLGEEAVVPLEGFSLDGGDRKWMRRVIKDADKAHLEFVVVPPSDVPPLLPELRRISDDWLGGKTTREKGFSLGRFDERYLSHFPTALIRERSSDGSRIVAFANIWAGAPGGEVSPDLMRRTADAPRGTMDLLFVQLLLWGQAQGYRSANLGMTPLAGLMDPALARPELAPLWARAGTFLYGRGESFYNFQGLRAFKEKFSPVWEPRYLASPGGIALPRVLANVATLIAGGVGGIVHK